MARFGIELIFLLFYHVFLTWYMWWMWCLILMNRNFKSILIIFILKFGIFFKLAYINYQKKQMNNDHSFKKRQRERNFIKIILFRFCAHIASSALFYFEILWRTNLKHYIYIATQKQSKIKYIKSHWVMLHKNKKKNFAYMSYNIFTFLCRHLKKQCMASILSWTTKTWRAFLS